MPTFDGARGLWMFQYADRGSGTLGSAEQDMDAVCDTALQYAGSTVVLQKVADGLNFQAAFDAGVNAIDSVATWQAAQVAAARKGVTALPWVVPQLANQAAFHSQFGPELVVDLEPDTKYFWQDSISAIPTYFDRLRQNGVHTIHVSLDPRQSARQYLNVAGWSANVDSLMGQHYWTDFQRPWEESVPDVQALKDLHPNCYPTLPYDAAPADLAAFWQECIRIGCNGLSLWRLGPATAAQLQAFAALPLPNTPTNDCAAQLLQAQGQIISLQQQATAVQNQLAGALDEQARLQGVINAVRQALGV